MASLVLPENEVHAWHVPHEGRLPELEGLLGLLSCDEHERAARFRFERDRTTFCLSRAYLRLLVQSYGLGPAEQVRFSYSAQGKPELADSWLRFNLAHCLGMTVLAVAHTRPVGIDVECLRDVHDADAIVGHLFAPEEQAAYQALAPSERQRGFFNAWTRKEAFIKATGEGLSRRLDSFAVTLAPDGPARFLRIDPDSAGWLLTDLTIAAPHIVALATQGTLLRVRNRVWPLDGLKPE